MTHYSRGFALCPKVWRDRGPRSIQGSAVRISRKLLLISVAVAWLIQDPIRADEPEPVLVMDFRAQGARAEEALAVTNQFRTQLLKTGKFALVDRSRMATLLDELALQKAECLTEECAARVGRLLGVPKVVSGSLTRLSENVWQISILISDVQTGETLTSESQTYEGSLVSVIQAGVPDLTARLARVRALTGGERAVQAVPQRGSVFRDLVTGTEFVFIPGGEYVQGCGPRSGACDEDEYPSRRVRISEFWLAKTEVTVVQFERFWKDGGFSSDDSSSVTNCTVTTATGPRLKIGASFRRSGTSQESRHPVVCVSWKNAQAFAIWLSQKSGERYRLPTEAEWEYACRDGSKMLKYSWGDGEPSGNVADEGARSSFPRMAIFKDYRDGYDRTAPIASFSANQLGIFDMTGNVREWVHDTYADYVYNSLVTTDPVYTASGVLKVHRGGGWNDGPPESRCTNRGAGGDSERFDSVGFRLARTK